MDKQKILLLIPARFASTRFPGKPLAKIAGISMIQRVFDNCSKGSSDYSVHVCVVTDDQRIEDHVNEFGGNIVRVDDDVPSGTERIALAYERFFSKDDYQLVINVQGDEPLLKSQQINELIKFHLSTKYDVSTVVQKRSVNEDFTNSNKVKVIFSESSSQCLYFSRASIPFVRDEGDELDHWFFHIGVYSYTPSALKKFVSCEMGRYENLEKLEQLRGLENSLTYGAIQSDVKLMGIDTPEDLEKLEQIMKEKV